MSETESAASSARRAAGRVRRSQSFIACKIVGRSGSFNPFKRNLPCFHGVKGWREQPLCLGVRHPMVQRPFAGADNQEIDAAKQHCEVSARFMHRAPEAQTLHVGGEVKQ